MFPSGQALSDPVLPNSKLPWIQSEVVNHCDAIDGVTDGLISDPRKCSFYPPRDLRCGVSSSPNCLKPEEAEVLRRIYDGIEMPGGDILTGYSFGCEGVSGGWDTWITYDPFTLGFFGFPNYQYGFSQGILRYMMYNNPTFDFHNFDSKNDFNDTLLLSSFAVANNTDLGAFKARGGKMIMYNGWCDPILPPLGAIRYYEKAQSDPANTKWGREDIRHFYRLFLLPGVLHCGSGPGPGNSGVDFLTALELWVEKGKAPEKIIASHVTGGVVDRTRPLCPYPQEAVYKGTGSINDAANFTCKWPH
jgi:feruloyl esterase